MRGPLDLNALVDEALTRALNDARPRRVVVQAALDATLPPVTGDAVQLQQVVANLLGNAFDALGGSERPPVLRVITGMAGPDAVMVSIEDNGGGISPEIRQKIFQPFFTTKPGGMGMGLLFCRAVVEAHGGRLWLDEGRSGGALFRFTLPADVPEADVKTELAR